MIERNREAYIAGRFQRRDEFRDLIPRFNEIGWGVPARWLTSDHTEAHRAAQMRYAFEDREDIGAATAVVFFTETPDIGYATGGRHVEFGIAQTLGKVTIVVGPEENVFHTLATFRVDTLDEALAILRAFR